MCAFNAQAFIEAAIDSVLAQTFKNFELIVVDDGSSDGTAEIAKRKASEDKRIRVVSHNKNYGLIEARNRSIAESSADIVAVADADDLLYPCRLQRQFDLLTTRSEVGVVGSAVEFFSSQKVKLPYQKLVTDDSQIRFAMRLHPAFWNTTTMYVRELFDHAGNYRQGFERGAEDYDLWCRLLSITRFANIPEPLVRVRLHDSSITSANEDCLNNILRISAGALAEYLNMAVPFSLRKAVHCFLMHEGMALHEYRDAIDLLRSIEENVRASESAPIRKCFFRQLAAACIVHSQYNVYRDPLLSDQLYSIAKRLRPRAFLGLSDVKLKLQRIRRSFL